jgi:hypothetical protein
MNRERDLARRLLAQDGLLDESERERRRVMMREALESERVFVRRLRRASVTAWSLTLWLPVAGILAVLAWTTDGDTLLIPTAMLGILGSLSLIVAVITTVAWLFRSRSSTLTAIEMHLAALEEALRTPPRE